jgi:polyisoprenyl-phosphate glycosyltransferase
MPSPASATTDRSLAGVVYSVVIPVYGNEENIPYLVPRLEDLHRQLDAPMEAVFVVDGSPDQSEALLHEILKTSPMPSQLLAHSRNFGSFAAIRTGMQVARGEFIGVMAADLQEPPELMRDFFDALSSSSADVTVGRRVGREDAALSSLASTVFWGLYRKLINPAIPPGGVDVFGCTREVAQRLVSLPEANSSLVALLYWIGYCRVEVPYHRAARTHGTSAWSLRKRWRYLLDSIYSFTDIPIRVLLAVGIGGAAVTTGVGAVVFGAWLTGAIQEPGYVPLMLTILLSTFLLLSGLGVVGEYVWRTFENSKDRPGAITRGSWLLGGVESSQLRKGPDDT